MIHDERLCDLGEGPLWHPLRQQLFWFDILNRQLLSQDSTGAPLAWLFPDMVSAAGWIDSERLLIAGETGLSIFNLTDNSMTPHLPVEADRPETRSNDGRADPLGGFWFGTMGKQAQPGAGAIYRYYQGDLRKIFAGLDIPNAICFPPAGDFAHFTDTNTGKVMKVHLDAFGWPDAAPEVFIDLHAEGLNPDGAVIDADGVMWLAQWGAGRVAAYDTNGQFLRAVAIDAPHSSCPAFGGDTLYCTTARQGMSAADLAAHPNAGKVFRIDGVALGQPEHQVIL
ncbi:MAG: SMP-30/gluconolactonase/LRE family protein [Cypionkella sp.]